jgi:hypothetical protein
VDSDDLDVFEGGHSVSQRVPWSGVRQCGDIQSTSLLRLA